MLIAILVVCIIGLVLTQSRFNGLEDRIVNLEVTADEIKDQTDKLGTNNYK